MTGKTNAVTEMNLEKPQVSRSTRSGPALPEIKRRRIDDKVILRIKPNFSSISRNQNTSIRRDYPFSEEAQNTFRLVLITSAMRLIRSCSLRTWAGCSAAQREITVSDAFVSQLHIIALRKRIAKRRQALFGSRLRSCARSNS